MNDEQAALHELNAARDRHHARQAGKDALALLSALSANDTETAERIVMTTELPRCLAFAAGSYGAGILLAFSDLAEDTGVIADMMRRLMKQIVETEFGG